MLLIFILASGSAFANPSTEGVSDTATQNEFNIGDFIFHHIGDDYSWHIAKIGGRDIAIPLLIIVKSEDRGWFCFSSNKLHHHGDVYEGFTIGESGKVMEILPDGTQIRPWDFSITKNVCSIFISCFILCWLFLSIAKRYKRNALIAPKGAQGLLEPVILFVYNDVIKVSIGKNYQRYVPYLLTVFFFILLNNLLGLVPIFPGGANVTGNIAVTMVLSLITFVMINLFGTKEYWKDIFWPEVPIWMKVPVPFMPVVEFLSMLIKPIALMVRLFANMMSGHMIVLVLICMIFVFGAMNQVVGGLTSIVSMVFSVFMLVLDLLISFIQAYVFTLFSAIFIGLSQVESHHHKKEKV